MGTLRGGGGKEDTGYGSRIQENLSLLLWPEVREGLSGIKHVLKADLEQEVKTPLLRILCLPKAKIKYL